MENNSRLPSIVYPSSLRSLLHLSFYFTFVTFLALFRRATVLWTCSLRRDFIPRRMISLFHFDYYTCCSRPSQVAYKSLFLFIYWPSVNAPWPRPHFKRLCVKIQGHQVNWLDLDSLIDLMRHPARRIVGRPSATANHEPG